jgi:hypothetical protein
VLEALRHASSQPDLTATDVLARVRNQARLTGRRLEPRVGARNPSPSSVGSKVITPVPGARRADQFCADRSDLDLSGAEILKGLPRHTLVVITLDLGDPKRCS